MISFKVEKTSLHLSSFSRSQPSSISLHIPCNMEIIQRLLFKILFKFWWEIPAPNNSVHSNEFRRWIKIQQNPWLYILPKIFFAEYTPMTISVAFEWAWMLTSKLVSGCIVQYSASRTGAMSSLHVLMTFFLKFFFKYSRDYIETCVYCYAIYINSRIIELPKTEKILSDCNKVNEQYIS